MRILLWNGWLLDGSGSNVYTAKVADIWQRQGHDVVIVCHNRLAASRRSSLRLSLRS